MLSFSKPCSVRTSAFHHSWLSFPRLPVALVSHLPESQMPIGTGFAQLLRGLGTIFFFTRHHWLTNQRRRSSRRFSLGVGDFPIKAGCRIEQPSSEWLRGGMICPRLKQSNRLIAVVVDHQENSPVSTSRRKPSSWCPAAGSRLLCGKS